MSATISQKKPFFRSGTVIALLLGSVLAPAVLTFVVAVLLLVFAKATREILFGVMVLVFTSSAIIGLIVATVFASRTARLANLQNQFVANVSHELRTPLTSIRLFVESLHTGRITDPEQVRHCMEILATETDRLTHLIEQILEWKPLSRELPFVRHLESVALLVDEAVRPFLVSPDGQQAVPSIEVRVAQGLPSILVDRESFLTALRNLIHNAVKFGTEEPITLTARSANSGVAISVQDQGPGIEGKELERIFQRFYRVQRPNEPDPGGTGLGLAITRQIVENHNGTITAESEVGQGSTFTIYLPPGRPHDGP